ncbi:MAG: Glu/Leu/Phe/Val family dehydrogenase [Gaiellaceae bacterium]
MDASWRKLTDELGPELIVLVSEPRVGLEGVVVIDNTALGSAMGGMRMALDVTVEEVCRLARAMTFKNAAAGLPYGGGKSAIVADPAMPADRKERVVRAFAHALRDLRQYTPGPDMGVDEACMGYVFDEIGRAAGRPRVLGGIPIDELGCTALGLAVAAEVAAEHVDVELTGARAVIQGFGAVGSNTALRLAERGVLVVAVADSRGAVVNLAGLDVASLIAFKADGHSVGEFSDGEPLRPDALVGLDCEIWVPAARPDVFTLANVDDVRARLVLSGANIPATVEAEERLHQRGVLLVPDFIANAGGVIAAAVGEAGGTESQALSVIEETVRRNTRELLVTVERDGVSPRIAGTAIARARVEEATGYRRAF